MITRLQLLTILSLGLLFFVVGNSVRASIVAGYYPLVIAGDPNGSPPDSPDAHIDYNTSYSPFAGVGSLRVENPLSSAPYLASGVPISRYHVLTAAHTFDRNFDGTADVLPSEITFNLNFDGDLDYSIGSSALVLHPDFTGFRPWLINDDLAIITLSSPLPEGVTIYELYRDTFSLGTVLTMVGYGKSGDGVSGYSGLGSYSVKRTGQNAIDLFGADDENGGSNEIFAFDFDGPDSTTNQIGDTTLGNDIESQLGPGDSGSPSFIFDDQQWKIAGINTVAGTFEDGPAPPYFGSAGGGMLTFAYNDWIDSVIIPEPASIVVWSLLTAFMLPLAWSRKLQTINLE